MTDSSQPNAGSPTSGSIEKCLSASDANLVDRVVERRFQDRRIELVTDERWGKSLQSLNSFEQFRAHSRRRARQLLAQVEIFASRYAELLGRTVIEHVKELTTLLFRAHRDVGWEEVRDASFRFIDRFVDEANAYAKTADPPLGGNMPFETFQRCAGLVELFREAKELATPEDVARAFSEKINAQEWRNRAAKRAEEEFRLMMTATSGDQAEPVTKNSSLGPSRKAFITSLLQKKGFSVHDWAKASNVDFHTANNYLNGKSKPYPNTIKKLAEALGVEVTQLPE